jgi:hypothetical protein
MATKKEARKGIKTQAGEDMADKRFQLDEDEADLNNDGRLSGYERQRGEAIQKATGDEELDDALSMYHGGIACGMGDGLMVDEYSGNPVPVGSGPENVRDDIEVMISDGEYVLPADVVKWHGLKHIMEMQDEAKMGLMGMYDMGLIQYVEEESEDDEEPQETPEGNEVEVAEVEVEIEEPEVRETDEYIESDYGTKTSMFGMVKKPKMAFIV